LGGKVNGKSSIKVIKGNVHKKSNEEEFRDCADTTSEGSSDLEYVKGGRRKLMRLVTNIAVGEGHKIAIRRRRQRERNGVSGRGTEKTNNVIFKYGSKTGPLGIKTQIG